MAIGIGNLFKLAKGALGPDELAELFEQMGFGFEMREIQPGQVPMIFQRAYDTASRPGATVMQISVTRDGTTMTGLLVAPPPIGGRAGLPAETKTGAREIPAAVPEPEPA